MVKPLSVLLIAASLAAAGCSTTPLIKAVRSRDFAQVKTLVEAGADINKRDSLGPLASPLGHAWRVNAPDIAAYLVRQGAADQDTVLMTGSAAASEDSAGVIQAMLDAGAVPPAGFPAQKYRTKTTSAQAPRGNLDDAAYDRMRAAAGMPPEKKEPSSDIDAPSRRGAERPDDFALVIGIEDYQSLPKADYGARDAKTVRRHLEALGFPARNIVSLEGSQATGSKLRSYLQEWLPLNVKASSTLFVYFSGHGAPDTKTGEAYLVPWDGDPKFLKSTALPLKTLYADLAKTKAKRVVVALDACFSGAGGRSVLAQGARPLVAKAAELAPTEARLTILAAASGDEITGTLQEQSHGLFTYHLLKGLSADPKASAKSLFDYLKPRVQDDARRENREQTPVLAGTALGEPLLAP